MSLPMFAAAALTPSPSVPSASLALASRVLCPEALRLQRACAPQAYLEVPQRV